jgi:sugar phosphate isomerase/epimerase/predicted phosphodiesterase
MKICVMEDLHLPYHKEALQYEALAFYLSDMQKNGADLLIVPGDFTADGNKETAARFFSALASLPIPAIVMTGNADYRNPETAEYFRSVTASPRHTFADATILALRDGEGSIPAQDLALLDAIDAKTLVFLHHPIDSLKEPCRARLRAFREQNPEIPIFVGHAHIDKREERTFYLNAADPDKAIGEEPCIYYYDTETATLSKTHYPCKMPADFTSYVGISAFRPLADLAYAAKAHLYAVEFRPSVIGEDRDALLQGIREFRAQGGKILSFHFPDLASREGVLAEDAALLSFCELVRACGGNRVTMHAPSVPLRMLKEDPNLLSRIADLAAKAIEALPLGCEIGIENMHMTATDTAEDRRFGYTPEECRLFIEMLRARTAHSVGFHFDTGHARNNMPLSQIYTQSVWMAELGMEIAGYHIHQVLLENGKFVNHYPITEPYGALISYATFFRMWESGRMKKAPVVLEIRPTAEDAAPYKRSLAWMCPEIL